MPKLNQKTKSGFTIIEVVLVLAIAGLIFLMVFLALPALQRSQRDTSRRDALAGFATQITNYQSNNRGRLPQTTADAWGKFLTSYMKQEGDQFDEGEGEFVDPDGTNYGITNASICTLKNKACSTPGTGNFLEESTSVSGGAELKTADAEFNHTIYIVYGAKCDGEAVVPVTGNGSRQVAFLYKLEGGGVYCNSNS